MLYILAILYRFLSSLRYLSASQPRPKSTVVIWLDLQRRTLAFRVGELDTASPNPRNDRQGAILVHIDPQEYTSTSLLLSDSI